jgi:hypothetical protein
MNNFKRVLPRTLAALTLTMVAQAAPPVGTWSANSNGYGPGAMVLSVDAAGNVTGTFHGNPVKGFWSESASRLVFYRAIGGNTASSPPDLIQIYTGHMFPCSVSAPAGAQCIEGTFQAFQGTGATAPRNVFGWYATK